MTLISIQEHYASTPVQKGYVYHVYGALLPGFKELAKAGRSFQEMCKEYVERPQIMGQRFDKQILVDTIAEALRQVKK